MTAAIFAAIFFVLIPSSALAFPMTEGTSSISALIGGLAALIAGFAPRAGRSSGVRALMIATVLLLLVSIAEFALIDVDRRSHLEEEEFVRQNRVTSNLDIPTYLPARPATVGEGDVAWAAKNLTFLDLEEFRRGDAAPGAEAIYVSIDETEKYQPSMMRGFSQHDLASLRTYSLEADRPIVLVSESLRDLISASRVLRENGANKIDVLWTTDLFSDVEASGLKTPYYEDSDNIFYMNAVDIRPSRAVGLTHNTLANAVNLPASDLMIMRNEDLMSAITWPAVFVSSSEAMYSRLDARLRGAGLRPGVDYHFYKNGLEWHFEEERHSVVPFHYNVRLVDPMKLHMVALLTDRLRFICTKPDQCQDSIPTDLRIDIPFADLGREAAREAIQALPEDYLYTVISSGQETAVNALMTGWWLNLAGRDYLGEFIMHERFSVGGFREKMVEEFGYGTTTSDWRSGYAARITVIEGLNGIVDRYGWVMAFLGLGALLRLALMPALIASARCAYVRPNVGLGLASSLVLLGALVPTYVWLEEAISYYAVVPHAMMQVLMAQGWPWLDDVLACLLGLHVVFSAPGKTRQNVVLCLVLAGLWGKGVFDGVPDPLAVFLIAGEIVALGVLIPFALRYLRTSLEVRKGFYRRLGATQAVAGLPEKWVLANSVAPQPGFLVDLGAADDGMVARAAMRLGCTSLIVRSASSKRCEQELGGFHHSAVVAAAARPVRAALEKLRADGCDFAWIQPYIECERGAVISSIGATGRRAEVLIGPAQAATEGSGLAELCATDGPQSDRGTRSLLRLLKRVERRVDGPVVIEAGLSGGKAHLFQVRRQELRVSQEAGLYPLGIEGFVLAEDFIARCSRLTGSIIGHVTKGDFVFVRGFLYRKRKPALMPRPFGRKGFVRFEAELIDLAGAVEKQAGLATRLDQLDAVLSMYRRAYRMSQSLIRPRRVVSSITPQVWEAWNAHDLEISGSRRAQLDRLGPPAPKPVRDALHDAIVVTGIVLNRIIADLCGYGVAREDLHIDALLVSGFTPGIDHRDRVPLAHPDACKVIVPGPMAGKPWPAQSVTPPPDDGNCYILMGDEISSHWVRSLHRFSGVLSVYGDANAHLGLSARALGIPYQKITQPELEIYLATSRIDRE